MIVNFEYLRLIFWYDFNEDFVYVKVEGCIDIGFIFFVFGFFQQDDDIGILYGGVVFVYNLIYIDILVNFMIMGVIINISKNCIYQYNNCNMYSNFCIMLKIYLSVGLMYRKKIYINVINLIDLFWL